MKKAIIAIVFVFAAGVLCAVPGKVMDKILVKVNDELILESEVEEAVDILKTQLKMSGKSMSRKKIREDVIKRIIEQKIIITVASEEEVVVSEEAVADKVNEFVDSLRSRFPDEEAFESALKKEGLSYTDFRIKIEAQVRDSVVFNKVKQKKQQEFIQKAAVSDDEIKKYYSENKSEFKVNDTVDISDIFFTRGEVETDNLDSYVAGIYDKIKNGESYEKMMGELNGKPGIGGGDLGEVDTIQMDAKIRQALKNPKKGKVLRPVNTEDGYHLIKINNYKKGTFRELSEIKGKVRVRIIEKKVDKMWDEWIEKVRKQAYIKYMD